LLLFFYFFVLLTSPLLLSYPFSYYLHFLSFICATIYCSFPLLLFHPLLIQSLPCLHLPLPSSPTFHVTLPSYTFTIP
jgi:hypothetical protein